MTIEIRPRRLVCLTGFMGSGKSTIGPLLAERLGWRFLDLDVEIERRDGSTVARIFAENGEPHFRKLEAAALAELLGRRRVVRRPATSLPPRAAAARTLSA